ncbi:MAG: hypothetical protein HOV78_11415 [Hamadaea sp.]|nr:hypothetical protein [Hamadaea sp.]
MTTKTITPELKLTTLKHLAGGKSLEVTASIVGLPRETVLDLASNHGYPDQSKLSWAADVLATKLDEQAKVMPERAPERPEPTPRPVAAVPRPAPAPAPAAKADDIQALLSSAKEHQSKRIQRAAEKVTDDIARLRDLIQEDERKHAERRRLEKEKAAARAEVERLEAQLAAAKAKLGGAKVATRSTGTPAKEIRAWARANGVDCPGTGRVPANVVDAYKAAHPEAAAS